MAGFSGVNDLAAKYSEGKYIRFPFYKAFTAPEAAGIWHSGWNVGSLPAAGGNPASTPGAAYTNAGINFKDTSSATKHLLTIAVSVSTSLPSNYAMLMLYDRLVGVGSISLTSTGDKTVNSAALTRYTDGMGVQAWLEVSTATTVTAPVVTLNSYTDNDNNSGQTGTAVTFPAAATDLHAMIQLPLASGDLGVRAVSTVNVGTAATAGAANLILIKPLAYFPFATMLAASRQCVLQTPPPVRIYDGASLGLAVFASGTNTAAYNGFVEVAYN